MSRRNTISREFFATIAAVLVLGLSVMCAIQTALSAAYFIGERKSSLTDVLNGATALSERFADEVRRRQCRLDRAHNAEPQHEHGGDGRKKFAADRVAAAHSLTSNL